MVIDRYIYKNNFLLWCIYIIALFFIGVDVFEDVTENESFLHIFMEAFFMIGLASIAFFLLLFVIKAKNIQEVQLFSTLKELDQTRIDLKSWKQKTSSFTKGLSQEIDSQFEGWQLSKSEKEVGLLLIKGISTKEIASFRNTAEKTVRVQLSSIYKKAGVSGRVEFCSFFLEDLLLPINRS